MSVDRQSGWVGSLIPRTDAPRPIPENTLPRMVSYPQIYPQVIYRVIHTLSPALSTGFTQPCPQGYPQSLV